MNYQIETIKKGVQTMSKMHELIIDRPTMIRYHAFIFGLNAAIRFANQDKRLTFCWYYKHARHAIERNNDIVKRIKEYSLRAGKPINIGTKIK
jgi:hypothetical protein